MPKINLGFTAMLLVACWSMTSAQAAPSGKVEALCSALSSAPDAASNARAQAVLGDCALTSGDTAGAIRHYRAALRLDATNIKVRADLARLLMLTGQVEAAKPVLREALVSNPGSADAAALSLSVDILEGRAVAFLPAASGWSGMVELGRTWSSNINAGSGASTFDAIIAGTLIELNVAEDAKGRGGWATELAGRASYLHQLGADNAVIFTGDVSGTTYDTESQFSHADLAFGLGYVQRQGDLTWSVTPNLALRWQGNEGLSQAGYYLDGRISLALNDQLALVASGKLGHSRRIGSTDLSGTRFVGSAGVDYELQDGITLGAYLGVERAALGSGTESFTKVGPRVVASAALGETLDLDLAYGYSLAWFDQTSPVFPQARRDGEHAVSAALSQDLSALAKGLSAVGEYSFRTQDSTVDFYDRSEHRVTAKLRYSF